mmetsp:Transcript_4292/g.8220  ORF Transcript_4292/g.8220 Transcript_4292/m.8220 type:complete len:121 (+) Transcript_4292:92-454(+)
MLTMIYCSTMARRAFFQINEEERGRGFRAEASSVCPVNDLLPCYILFCAGSSVPGGLITEDDGETWESCPRKRKIFVSFRIFYYITRYVVHIRYEVDIRGRRTYLIRCGDLRHAPSSAVF